MRTDIWCAARSRQTTTGRTTRSNPAAMSDVINTKQLEDVFKNVEANTKYLVDASAANERHPWALR